MKKILLIIAATLLLGNTHAQNGVFQGMANASVALYDFWGNHSNQAGLAKSENPQIGVCYNNGFLVNETGTQTLAVLYPTKTGNFNINYLRYGYSQYSENTAGLGYSRIINDFFSAAIQFDYFYLAQSEAYKNKSLFLFEVGFIAQPVDKLQIGVHAYNPLRAKISDYQNERVATIFRFGLAYHFSDAVLFSVETEKDLDKDIRIKSGLAYKMTEPLRIYAGIASGPNQFSIGLGYQLQSLHINIAFTTHPTLPISSQGAVSYEFK